SSTGLYLQTRPTGNAASLLMCTLVNNIGGDASAVTITYDFTKITAGEEVDNLEVYYSLTGLAGSWTPIPAFYSAGPGHLSTTINLNWSSGGNLYILRSEEH